MIFGILKFWCRSVHRWTCKANYDAQKVFDKSWVKLFLVIDDDLFCCLSSNWFLLSEHYGCLSMFGYTQKIACDLFKFDMIFFKSSANHLFIFSAIFFCFPWGTLRRRWDGGVLGIIFLKEITCHSGAHITELTPFEEEGVQL